MCGIITSETSPYTLKAKISDYHRPEGEGKLRGCHENGKTAEEEVE